MKWENGRTLNDPKEFEAIKEMYFAIDYPLGEQSNDELMEMQSIRNRNILNQAR